MTGEGRLGRDQGTLSYCLDGCYQGSTLAGANVQEERLRLIKEERKSTCGWNSGVPSSVTVSVGEPHGGRVLGSLAHSALATKFLSSLLPLNRSLAMKTCFASGGIREVITCSADGFTDKVLKIEVVFLAFTWFGFREAQTCTNTISTKGPHVLGASGLMPLTTEQPDAISL